MTTTNEITLNSTEKELMAAYERYCSKGAGEAVGFPSDAPATAAMREGWCVIRRVYHHTDRPGVPVLAKSPSGDLWVVNDIHGGPWAILVAGCLRQACPRWVPEDRMGKEEFEALWRLNQALYPDDPRDGKR